MNIYIGTDVSKKAWPLIKRLPPEKCRPIAQLVGIALIEWLERNALPETSQEPGENVTK